MTKKAKLLIAVLAALMCLSLGLFVACNGDTHTHSYTQWAYNDAQHWKVCPDDGAKDSSMLESVPATARKIPACWKASRQWRERWGCAMYTHYDTHTHLALYSNSVMPIKQKWHHTSRAMPLKNLWSIDSMIFYFILSRNFYSNTLRVRLWYHIHRWPTKYYHLRYYWIQLGTHAFG